MPSMLFLLILAGAITTTTPPVEVPLGEVVSMRMPNTNTFGNMLKGSPRVDHHRKKLLELQKALFRPSKDTQRATSIAIVPVQGIDAIESAIEHFRKEKPSQTYTPGKPLTAVFYARHGNPSVRIDRVLVKGSEVKIHYAWRTTKKGWKHIRSPARYSNLAFIPLPAFNDGQIRVEVIAPKDTPEEIAKRVCQSALFQPKRHQPVRGERTSLNQ